MSGLSESIQARLRALAETFSAELPRRMQEIADNARAVLREGAAAEEIGSLRHNVHKLAGSAATFGFHHVTSCAKRLEHLLDELIDHDRFPGDEERARIRMLVSELGEATRIGGADAALEELEEAGADESRDETAFVGFGREAAEAGAADFGGRPHGDEATDPNRRVVAILVESAELGRDLGERFQFYGFETEVLESVSGLTAALCQGCQTAVIVDIRLIDRDPTVAEEIHAVVGRSEGRVHVLYVSDRDDFAVRLLAVRTAGAAFFSVPIDTQRIVDTVDGLTSSGGEPFHVLVVDDDIEQVSYHALVLQRAGMITSVVSDATHLFAVLIESKPDLILMDMYMPGCTGPELAAMIRQQEAFVGVPIVFLSIETDTDKQFEALSRGGDGFLSKPIRPDHLITAVKNRVERTRSMRFFMERDSLTGLLNHSHLMQSLSTEMQRADRVGRPLCFAMIDIDNFKTVNDTYGHLTGDRVLKSLSRLLQERLRKTDVIGRYGGEEFGVVMFNVNTETAGQILDRIREEFAQSVHEAGEREFNVTFSAGIAGYPRFDGAGMLSDAADRALYAAKERGRNRVVTV